MAEESREKNLQSTSPAQTTCESCHAPSDEEPDEGHGDFRAEHGLWETSCDDDLYDGLPPDLREDLLAEEQELFCPTSPEPESEGSDNKDDTVETDKVEEPSEEDEPPKKEKKQPRMDPPKPNIQLGAAGDWVRIEITKSNGCGYIRWSQSRRSANAHCCVTSHGGPGKCKWDRTLKHGRPMGRQLAWAIAGEFMTAEEHKDLKTYIGDEASYHLRDDARKASEIQAATDPLMEAFLNDEIGARLPEEELCP